MSWSVYYESRKDFDEEMATPGSTAILPQDVEMGDQLKAARAAAVFIVESGAIGAADVKIGLYGHANPEHKPRDGYANDCITVSVTQKAAS